MRVFVTESLPAPAKQIYDLLADYRVGHPSILPRAFHGLVVEEGGQGAGTVIRFQTTVMGKTETLQGVVTEPEAGRVLVESYPEKGMVTRFVVDPVTSETCTLTIETEWQPRGMMGLLERLVAPAMLRGIFREEIGNIRRRVAAAFRS